ncbi:MAG TPA: DUF503 domain-containing protein [Myxococcaceae bacterium]|nr:DUF503 domain-containing protein [Myxococcaceae bacterium]
MFIAVGRVVLQIQESGSLKDKRQVVRKVTDRLRARFNVSIAEVGEQDRWQRAVLGLSVVAEERRHADAQLEKILHAIDEMYLAPMVSRQTEILSLGERLYTTVPAGEEEGEGEGLDLSDGDFDLAAHLARGDRSMAEAEGLGRWEDRGRGEPETPQSREEAIRARARALRNPREWEKS